MRTNSELRSSLGIAGFQRRFIMSFEEKSAPLHAEISVKNEFKRTVEMNDSFKALKKALSYPQGPSFPDLDRSFIVETDASYYDVGAVLQQKKEAGELHPIQFPSRTMTEAERINYARERDKLAVIFLLRKSRLYLLSTEPFVYITHH